MCRGLIWLASEHPYASFYTYAPTHTRAIYFRLTTSSIMFLARLLRAHCRSSGVYSGEAVVDATLSRAIGMCSRPLSYHPV